MRAGGRVNHMNRAGTIVLLPGAVLVGLSLAYCQPARSERGRAMTKSTAELILERLANSERTGRLDGLEIEFWKGGGLPPPNYKSDQLRLMTAGGREVIEFASLRWDSRFDPPSVQDKWILAVDPADVSEVARLLQSTQVFTGKYAEEVKPGIADIFSYEILVTADGRQEKRTYYRKLPEQLAPLQTAFDKLIELAKAQGRKALYHQGKEVQR